MQFRHSKLSKDALNRCSSLLSKDTSFYVLTLLINSIEKMYCSFLNKLYSINSKFYHLRYSLFDFIVLFFCFTHFSNWCPADTSVSRPRGLQRLRSFSKGLAYAHSQVGSERGGCAGEGVRSLGSDHSNYHTPDVVTLSGGKTNPYHVASIERCFR